MNDARLQHPAESLLARLAEGTLTASEFDVLNRMLSQDASARELYRKYMVIDALLRWEISPPLLKTADEIPIPSQPNSPSIHLYPSHSFSFLSPFSSFLSLNTPLGNVAFSYAVSAVLVCIGLWIFSLMSASSPRDAVVNNNNSVAPRNHIPPDALAPAREIVSVARITGTVDCVWADANYAPFHDRVMQGDKFMLKSGLMEITYYTGAKVILQGPCTYEAESAAGGYLSLGKLTARVEKRSGRGGEGERGRLANSTSPASSASSSSPSLPPSTSPPLFSVRTPTATVTDLGTEFGVEVTPEQGANVYVFRGVVEVSRDAKVGVASVHERLVAGEALRFASPDSRPKHMTVKSLDVAPMSHAMLVRLHESERSRVLAPAAIVASAYRRVWDAKGNLLADNDRLAAFQMATDGVFGRGANGEGPCSSFDTLNTDGTKTDFVGLTYSRRVRIDRVKVFLGHQSADGGGWREMPRMFILKNPVDTGGTPPENDPDNWRELSLHRSFGPTFNEKHDANPGKTIELLLNGNSEADRIGYGWAIGGAKGNGAAGFVSITELRAYGVIFQEEQAKGGP